MGKGSGEVKTTEKPPSPKEINAKDVEIMHPKLGRVKIGDISKNEQCRMIRDLVVETMKMRNQIYVAEMILNEFKMGDIQDARKKVEEKIKNQENLKKQVEDIKNKPVNPE